jgi:hypothetical protein
MDTSIYRTIYYGPSGVLIMEVSLYICSTFPEKLQHNMNRYFPVQVKVPVCQACFTAMHTRVVQDIFILYFVVHTCWVIWYGILDGLRMYCTYVTEHLLYD